MKTRKTRTDILRNGAIVAQAVSVADGVYYAITSDNGKTWWGHSFENVSLEVWASRFDSVSV